MEKREFGKAMGIVSVFVVRLFVSLIGGAWTCETIGINFRNPIGMLAGMGVIFASTFVVWHLGPIFVLWVKRRNLGWSFIKACKVHFALFERYSRG